MPMSRRSVALCILRLFANQRFESNNNFAWYCGYTSSPSIARYVPFWNSVQYLGTGGFESRTVELFSFHKYLCIWYQLYPSPLLYIFDTVQIFYKLLLILNSTLRMILWLTYLGQSLRVACNTSRYSVEVECQTHLEVTSSLVSWREIWTRIFIRDFCEYIPHHILLLLVRYLNTNSFLKNVDDTVEAEDIITLLHTADKYLLPDLVGRCASWIASRLDETNVAAVYSHGKAVNSTLLMSRCKLFSARHSLPDLDLDTESDIEPTKDSTEMAQSDQTLIVDPHNFLKYCSITSFHSFPTLT